MFKGKLGQTPLFKYFREILVELKKVSWPTKQDTTQMTLLVITVSAIVAVYLGGIDFLLTRLMSLLIQ